MFLALCQEALGLTPTEALDSDYVMIVSVLKEHSYIINDRNRQMSNDENVEGEYVEVIDFETGEMKRVQKVTAV